MFHPPPFHEAFTHALLQTRPGWNFRWRPGMGKTAYYF
jgi:hypothetical protein